LKKQEALPVKPPGYIYPGRALASLTATINVIVPRTRRSAAVLFWTPIRSSARRFLRKLSRILKPRSEGKVEERLLTVLKSKKRRQEPLSIDIGERIK